VQISCQSGLSLLSQPCYILCRLSRFLLHVRQSWAVTVCKLAHSLGGHQLILCKFFVTIHADGLPYCLLECSLGHVRRQLWRILVEQ
jgi:hypothetical protein